MSQTCFLHWIVSHLGIIIFLSIFKYFYVMALIILLTFDTTITIIIITTTATKSNTIILICYWCPPDIRWIYQGTLVQFRPVSECVAEAHVHHLHQTRTHACFLNRKMFSFFWIWRTSEWHSTILCWKSRSVTAVSFYLRARCWILSWNGRCGKPGLC